MNVNVEIKQKFNREIYCQDIQQNKWHVRIMKKHIGFYDDIKEAEKARKEAEIKYYGEYAYKGE